MASPISRCRSCRRLRPLARFTLSVSAAHIRPRARRVTASTIARCRRQAKGRAPMPGLLRDHIAVVTGAGSGIGRAIALGFAREGATLAVLDIETAAKTVADIHADGGRAQAFALDITDRLACRDVAAKVAREIGQVSVLVNNAGINRRKAFAGEPDAVIKDWQDIMAVNLNGLFNVTHAARRQGSHRQSR